MKAKHIDKFMKHAKKYVLDPKPRGLGFGHLFVDEGIFKKSKKKVTAKRVRKVGWEEVIIAGKVIPKPDNKHGYTDTLIKQIMTKKEYKYFNKWMYGQTCAIDEKTNEVITYPCDVLRFLEMVRLGKPTYWD